MEILRRRNILKNKLEIERELWTDTHSTKSVTPKDHTFSLVRKIVRFSCRPISANNNPKNKLGGAHFTLGNSFQVDSHVRTAVNQWVWLWLCVCVCVLRCPYETRGPSELCLTSVVTHVHSAQCKCLYVCVRSPECVKVIEKLDTALSPPAHELNTIQSSSSSLCVWLCACVYVCVCVYVWCSVCAVALSLVRRFPNNNNSIHTAELTTYVRYVHIRNNSGSHELRADI